MIKAKCYFNYNIFIHNQNCKQIHSVILYQNIVLHLICYKVPNRTKFNCEVNLDLCLGFEDQVIATTVKMVFTAPGHNEL